MTCRFYSVTLPLRAILITQRGGHSCIERGIHAPSPRSDCTRIVDGTFRHVGIIGTAKYPYSSVLDSVTAIASPILFEAIIDSAGCELLVNPEHPEAIAEAVRWVPDYPSEAEATSRRGRGPLR